MELRYCYRISAEAKMAHDTETNEPAVAYLQVKMDAKKLPESYDESRRRMGNVIAKQHDWKEEWLMPISAEEYDENMDEDEDGI